MTHTEILSELAELLGSKNKAYGNNAHKTYCRFGAAAYTMRMMDKAERLEALSQFESDYAVFTHESRLDTLVDLLGYIFLYLGDMRTTGESPESTANMDHTFKFIQMMKDMTDEHIVALNNQFRMTWLHDSPALSDVIYEMYLTESVSVDDYILLAAYILVLLKEEDEN